MRSNTSLAMREEMVSFSISSTSSARCAADTGEASNSSPAPASRPDRSFSVQFATSLASRPAAAASKKSARTGSPTSTAAS